MSDSILGDIGNGIADFTGAVGSAISNVGTGISNLLTGGVGTNPSRLISAFRSQGIPDGAESEDNSTSASARFSDSVLDKDWRVKISNDLIYMNSPVMEPLVGTGGMIWPYLPTITMSHSAAYDTIQTAHTNYPFYAYKNSQVDDISIAGQFTVQSQDEGLYWLAAVHFLRTVTKMYFGQGANLGNPPPICKLNGYGDFVYKDVPVFVKSFNVTLDKECDYIAVQLGSGSNTKTAGTNISYVPTVSNITAVVVPVYSREKIKSFNLTEFSKGKLMLGSDGRSFI
jgi:hypothetical protein